MLNVLVLGAEQLASDIINEICLNCGDDGEYIYDGQPYYLNTRIINNAGNELDAFKNVDFHTTGLICVYSSQHTIDFLRDHLERGVLFSLDEKFDCLPLVLVYQPEDQKDDNEIEILRNEGQHLADM